MNLDEERQICEQYYSRAIADATSDEEELAIALHLLEEARLAALLCDGFSLRDAATELGWTIDTARSASKQLFARRGVSGQAAPLPPMPTGVLWFQDR